MLEGRFTDVESGIPENVRQLIERRIDRLTADERRVLEGASVVGMECSSVAIGAGLEESTEWVEEHAKRWSDDTSSCRLRVWWSCRTERSRLATSSATSCISRCRIVCCPPCDGHKSTGGSAIAGKRSTARASETLRRSWPCTSSRERTRPVRSATCSWLPKMPGIGRHTTRWKRSLGVDCPRSHALAPSWRTGSGGN